GGRVHFVVGILDGLVQAVVHGQVLRRPDAATPGVLTSAVPPRKWRVSGADRRGPWHGARTVWQFAAVRRDIPATDLDGSRRLASTSGSPPRWLEYGRSRRPGRL